MRCVCSYLCVWALCVQILAPPLVQCTYIGPTVHIHNFLLCFKSIYFLKRPPPPPLLLPPVCKGRTYLSRTPTADALRLLRRGVLSSIWLLFRRGWRRIIQRQELTDILYSAHLLYQRHFWWSDVRTAKIPFSEPTGPVDAYSHFSIEMYFVVSDEFYLSLILLSYPRCLQTCSMYVFSWGHSGSWGQTLRTRNAAESCNPVDRNLPCKWSCFAFQSVSKCEIMDIQYWFLLCIVVSFWGGIMKLFHSLSKRSRRKRRGGNEMYIFFCTSALIY